MDFFISKGCDVVILGCTHFLNVKNVFEKYSPVTIVDSVEGVVNHAIDISGVLGAEPLGQGVGCNEVQPQGDCSPSLFITGNPNSSYDFICSHYNIAFGGNI